MKIAVLVSGGLPNPTSGGGALTVHTILRQLIEEGHDTTVVAAHDEPYFDPAGASLDDRIAQLRSLGLEVVAFPTRAGATAAAERKDVRSRLRRVRRPNPLELYPTLADAETVRAAVEEVAPDVVFVYHFEALAASMRVTQPRVALVGDPSHLPLLYRWRDAWPSWGTARRAVRLQSTLRAQPRLMAEMLSACTTTGAFAAHHAAWFREHGVPGCRYVHTPVPDDAGPEWQAARATAAGDPPHILLLGHLQGIVTIDGLRVFARMLPFLERKLGREGFIVDVVGGYEPPAELERVLEHPAVRRHGHVEAPAEFLRRSTVLLVPTSIPLGIRVRIITGLSYGTCVVTHRANALGIPELEHGVNALLGSSPEELADAVVRATGDPAGRQLLEQGGRATYERFFAPRVAAAELVALFDDAARGAPVETIRTPAIP